MRVVTIARNTMHSPNMATQDAAILSAVEEVLKERGADVTHIEDGEAIPAADAVCCMSRTTATLALLRKAEEQGVKVFNPTSAIRNAERARFTRLLKEHDIPQPPFVIGKRDALPQESEFPLWVKRGDGWSCCKEDVCYAKNRDEALAAIALLERAGVEEFVYSKHIEGDIIKFYGVDGGFFFHTYPNVEKGKFGWEKMNGEQKHYPFDIEAMKDIVFAAAKATGLQIFGGDCIVDKEGDIYVIDINDFPSFGAVRSEAAVAIAELVLRTNK